MARKGFLSNGITGPRTFQLTPLIRSRSPPLISLHLGIKVQTYQWLRLYVVVGPYRLSLGPMRPFRQYLCSTSGPSHDPASRVRCTPSRKIFAANPWRRLCTPDHRRSGFQPSRAAWLLTCWETSSLIARFFAKTSNTCNASGVLMGRSTRRPFRIFTGRSPSWVRRRWVRRVRPPWVRRVRTR